MITASGMAGFFRVLSLASIGLAGACVVSGEPYDEPPPDTDDDPPASVLEHPVHVLGVIDGDTIIVDLDGVNEHVRMKGVNTPELHLDTDADDPEPFAEAARSYTQNNIGTEVELVFDSACGAEPLATCRDTYGRPLAYLKRSNGEDHGTALLARGLARVYVFNNEAFDKKSAYLALQTQAQDEQLGIWSE